MTVIETEFVLPLSFGVNIGPSWSTRIAESGGGDEQRIQKWTYPLTRLELVYDTRSPADYAKLLDLFMAVEGKTFGWLFAPPNDKSTALPGGAVNFDDSLIGTGDGVETDFQLAKTYSFGSQVKLRKITRPRVASVRCGVAGAETAAFTVDAVTGIVTFTVAPGPGQQVTAGFDFMIPVRFDTDFLPGVIGAKNVEVGLLTSSTVAVKEIRE